MDKAGMTAHIRALVDNAPPLTATQSDVIRAIFRGGSVANPLPVQPTPTWVYRYYSADDTLLYVGITCSLPRRETAHKGKSAWWPLHTRKTVVRYSDTASARSAELTAIRDEAPLYNIAGKQNP